MDGHDYEYLVAKYLRGHGYTGVKVTNGSGDFGVDVTAHRAGTNTPYSANTTQAL